MIRKPEDLHETEELTNGTDRCDTQTEFFAVKTGCGNLPQPFLCGVSSDRISGFPEGTPEIKNMTEGGKSQCQVRA